MDRNIWDESESELRRSWSNLLEKLRGDGVSYVVLGSGSFRSSGRGHSVAETRARLASLVATMLETSRDCGLCVLLEPLKASESDVVNSLGEALNFVDSLSVVGTDVRRLGVAADVNHVWEELRADHHAPGHRGVVRLIHLSAPDARIVPPPALLAPLAETVRRFEPMRLTFECEWTSAADFHQAWAYGLDLVSRLRLP